VNVPDRRTAAAIALVFAASAAALYVLYSRVPVLYDADAYYHLAVARAYGTQGILPGVEWARFSIMHEGFGDKEFLFHVLLVPFATLMDPTTGGFVVLALLGAMVASALAGAGLTAIGRWGLVLPLVVFGTATDFTMRMARLRPELVSLLLVLAAVHLAAASRPVLLGLVACVYALGYTAFQTLLGLCLVWFLYVLWAERRFEWRLLLYPLAGTALGLAIHPHFPANLRVWLVQNVDFFVSGPAGDRGAEILPRTTRDTLVLNLGWWVALLALWRSRMPELRPLRDTRLRDFTFIATAIFAVLYLLMARFITYLVPLATLAVVRALQADGARPGPSVRLGGRARVPLAVAIGCCVVWIPFAAELARERLERSPAYQPGTRADWEAFGRAVPDGAKVAAPWDAAEAYVFWAPQGRYLDLLDPVFMWAKDPEAYRWYVEMFEGREADIPLVARARLDSDFYADGGRYPRAKTRLRDDPRVERLYDGVNYLYRFVEGRNAGFLLDWKVVPADAPLPPPLDLVLDPRTASYPRAATEAERQIEGYVDGRRVPGSPDCLVFAHTLEIARPVRLFLEVAPYGRAQVYVDDALAAVIKTAGGAVLGEGIVVPLTLDAGSHRISLRTCRAGGQIGFYALFRGMEEREPGPRSSRG